MPIIVRCCNCNKVAEDNGDFSLKEIPEGVRVSDTYCPTCLAKNFPDTARRMGLLAITSR